MSYFLFVDIETTSLKPDQHRIVEIAAVLTNSKLEVLSGDLKFASGEVRPVPDHYRAVITATTPIMWWDEWCRKQHVKSGLVNDIFLNGVDLATAVKGFFAWWGDQRTLHGIGPAELKTVQLAGSSVQFDRGFLDQIPDLQMNLGLLSHRMLDLSSIRTAFKLTGMYDKVRLKETSSDVTHRALDDVRYDIDQARKIFEVLRKAAE